MTLFDLDKAKNRVIIINERSKKVKVKLEFKVKLRPKLWLIYSERQERKLNISNIIASMIQDMLEDEGYTEIQRNELAQKVGCVPSQINYVISSRFTPEHGYIVESRRGGGGYIRITRAEYDMNSLKLRLVNDIGQSLDENICRAHLKNLYEREIIDEKTVKIFLSALTGNAYREIPREYGDILRASIFKQMILNIL